MSSRRTVWSQIALASCIVLCMVLFSSSLASGQDDSAHRGRKYKAPLPTAHIEVLVTKKFNGKPIANAAVIFYSSLDGKDEGNLEVKTDPDGKAILDVLPIGSTVRVQVIATGFSTYAEEYDVPDPTRQISIAMIRPQEQISSYVDNQGKTAARKPGVQEPVRSKSQTSAKPTAPVTPTPQTSLVPDVNPKQ
jgi:hypothetical protein